MTHGFVAQWIERLSPEQKVVGSIPIKPTRVRRATVCVQRRENISEKMEAVATSEAPAALGAYSQAVKANGFVFVSGQLGIDPTTGELAGDTAGEQAAQALKNIKHILDTAGTGIEHVCRATIYLKDVEDFKEVDAVYAQAFIGSVKPARVAFGNNMIPKGALVEIDAIAVL